MKYATMNGIEGENCNSLSLHEIHNQFVVKYCRPAN